MMQLELNMAVAITSGFRAEFLQKVSSLGKSPARGLFIDSCYAHCQIGTQEMWMRSDSPALGGTVRTLHFCSAMLSVLAIVFGYLVLVLFEHGFILFSPLLFLSCFLCHCFGYLILIVLCCVSLQTIAKAVGDWYYDRRPFEKIDCPYPCNPTCKNRPSDD